MHVMIISHMFELLDSVETGPRTIHRSSSAPRSSMAAGCMSDWASISSASCIWVSAYCTSEASFSCTPEASRFTIMHSNPFIKHLYVIGAAHRTPARAARVREGTGGQSDRPRRVFGCHPHTTTGHVLGNQCCCFHVGCWSLWTTPT